MNDHVGNLIFLHDSGDLTLNNLFVELAVALGYAPPPNPTRKAAELEYHCVALFPDGEYGEGWMDFGVGNDDPDLPELMEFEYSLQGYGDFKVLDFRTAAPDKPFAALLKFGEAQDVITRINAHFLDAAA